MAETVSCLHLTLRNGNEEKNLRNVRRVFSRYVSRLGYLRPGSGFRFPLDYRFSGNVLTVSMDGWDRRLFAEKIMDLEDGVSYKIKTKEVDLELLPALLKHLKASPEIQGRDELFVIIRILNTTPLRIHERVNDKVYSIEDASLLVARLNLAGKYRYKMKPLEEYEIECREYLKPDAFCRLQSQASAESSSSFACL